MWTQRIMWIAWPAFMAACALELVVFAFADPSDLQRAGHPRGRWRPGVYTGPRFGLLGQNEAAGALTTLLRMTPAEINECPFDPAQRPEGCPGRG